ncbi:MAG: MmcQ/YjbR family DNA-binding protein [Planctomycetes bacterium]|nr:MmcQ/YjbR family DNA-binding protein [Planctomycetota bacterium]
MKPETIVARIMALPEVVEAPHFEARSFRVGGKIFATMPPDDEHLHVLVDADVARAAAGADPVACEELWWGKQLAGVRVRMSAIHSSTLAPLLEAAWRRRAPKRLLAIRDGRP